MNGDDRLIGEIHAMCKEACRQRAKLFTLIEEMREGDCPMGKDNKDRIKALEGKQARIIIIGAVVLAGAFGLERVLSLIP